MNTLVAVALLTVGQCGGGTYYASPTYYYTQPTYNYVRVEYPALHYDIRNEGKIYSKFYVPVQMPDGRTIKVPVINGMLPRVNTVYSDGYEHRICTYDTGVYFKGGVPKYQYSSGAKKTSSKNTELPVLPARDTSPASSLRDAPPIPQRTSGDNAIISHPPALQELPRKDTDMSSELDKKMVPVTPQRSTLEVREPQKEIPKLDAPTDEVEGFGKQPYQLGDEPDFTKRFPKYEE